MANFLPGMRMWSFQVALSDATAVNFFFFLTFNADFMWLTLLICFARVPVSMLVL